MPLSVERSEADHEFTVFPNPTTSTLKLTYNLSSQEQRLVVSDLLGSVVLSTTASPGSTHTTLHLRDLPAGTYFCRLGEEVRTFVVIQ
ncbi:MAG: T9SS type A sorting domain-containing protein [Armatimonadetes bacterium]|nr:T9SS type A sorting domain-containing protein [Armatimonadota bacterium]